MYKSSIFDIPALIKDFSDKGLMYGGVYFDDEELPNHRDYLCRKLREALDQKYEDSYEVSITSDLMLVVKFNYRIVYSSSFNENIETLCMHIDDVVYRCEIYKCFVEQVGLAADIVVSTESISQVKDLGYLLVGLSTLSNLARIEDTLNLAKAMETRIEQEKELIFRMTNIVEKRMINWQTMQELEILSELQRLTDRMLLRIDTNVTLYHKRLDELGETFNKELLTNYRILRRSLEDLVTLIRTPAVIKGRWKYDHKTKLFIVEEESIAKNMSIFSNKENEE